MLFLLFLFCLCFSFFSGGNKIWMLERLTKKNRCGWRIHGGRGKEMFFWGERNAQTSLIFSQVNCFGICECNKRSAFIEGRCLTKGRLSSVRWWGPDSCCPKAIRCYGRPRRCTRNVNKWCRRQRALC